MGSYFSSPKPKIPPLPESPVESENTKKNPDRIDTIIESVVPEENNTSIPEQQIIESVEVTQEQVTIEEVIPEHVKEPSNTRKRRKKKKH